MRDHTVQVDRSGPAANFEFAENFNVTVPFIDRHLDEGRGDKIAIRVVDGEEVTYAELARNVNRCGNALLDLGLKKGQRLLFMVKDCPEFHYVFWGAIKAGILPVPLNTLLRAKDYAYIVENSESAAVIYSPEFAAEVEPGIAQSGHNPAVCLPVEGAGENLKDKIAAASDALAPVPAKPDDDCFWLYSSGSTGDPKGVVHGHSHMVYTSELYGVGVIAMCEADIVFSAPKLFFAYGLGAAMTFPLWVGAEAVLYAPAPTPAAMFDVIEKYKPTVYYGVPTLYAAQLKLMEERDPDQSSIRVAMSAGEALPPDMFHRWKEKTGITLLDAIGTTEMLHIFICNTPERQRVGATGLVVPGYEARIVGEDGEDLPPGEIGALTVRGGSQLKTYWDNDAKTKATIIDGWVRTGDTYYMDEDGFFFCCGRSDDMLKVGGIWCSPVEIEAKLIEHPKVLEAAVVGRADEAELIKPEAYIVLNEADDAGAELEAELLEHCKSGLARNKYPRWFNFVDDLPKTATGKIQRFRLRG